MIDDASANLIVSRMAPIELPAGSNLVAYEWQTPIADSPPSACARIPGYEAGNSRR